MPRRTFVPALLLLSVSGFLFAQRAADPANRYFRLICLVHLKDSAQSADGKVPEFVTEGMAAAQAAQEASITASKADQTPLPGPRSAVSPAFDQRQTPAPAAMSSRPGILAWSMLKSDDGTMAIIQLVAADRNAFDTLFADRRPEIRIFEIGKDKPEAIQNELRKFRKDFDLQNFRVVVQ